MKIIAIGDIHGHDSWKKIVEQDTDIIVFIGDYFDSRDNIPTHIQMTNFKEILSLKRRNREKVIMLMGNHEFHYLPGLDQMYSGFQDDFQSDIREAIQDALKDKSIQMAFCADGWLFTHAGVTKTWANNWKLLDKKDLANGINNLFSKHPEAFSFTPGELNDSYGEEVCQTPIWVRPKSLMLDAVEDYKQAVGHTKQMELTHRNNFAFIDCLRTSGEYLTLINGKKV